MIQKPFFTVYPYYENLNQVPNQHSDYKDSHKKEPQLAETAI